MQSKPAPIHSFAASFFPASVNVQMPLRPNWTSAGLAFSNALSSRKTLYCFGWPESFTHEQDCAHCVCGGVRRQRHLQQQVVLIGPFLVSDGRMLLIAYNRIVGSQNPPPFGVDNSI